MLQDFLDDPVGGNAFALCLERQPHTVPHYIGRDRVDILWVDIVATGKPRVRASAFVARKRGADLYPTWQVIAEFSGDTHGIDRIGHVALDRVRHVNCHDLVSRRKRRGLRGRRTLFLGWFDVSGLHRCNSFAAHKADHFDFILDGWIGDSDTHREPVYLCFGQRICALLFDGALGRRSHEQQLHHMCRVSDGELPFLHRRQQCGLHLCGCAVDFIGQNNVCKDRPGLKAELGDVARMISNLGARHIRWQKGGGKLETAEVNFHVLGQRLDRAGFCKPGQSFDQKVPVCQKSDDKPVDHVALSNDRFRHPRTKSVYPFAGVSLEAFMLSNIP